MASENKLPDDRTEETASEKKPKKSYLSKQLTAVIIIAAALAVLIPIYFFLLKPMFEKTDEPEPEAAEVLYEPQIEGEGRMAASQAQVGKTVGGNVYIYAADISQTEQTVNIRSGKNGDWSFVRLVSGGSAYYMIEGYESIALNYIIDDFCSALTRPIAMHVAPSSDRLLDIQREKAAKMTAEELEKAGGWNALPITAADIADIEIDYAQYGLGDLSNADSVSFTDKSGGKKTLYLGTFTPDGTERYAMLDGTRAVYKLNKFHTAYFGCSAYDMMPVTVIDVPDSAATGDYMLDEFTLGRDGEAYVMIQRFDDSEVIAADKLTKSQVIETVGDIETSYDTSSEYTVLLYQYFLSGVEGRKVIGAVHSEKKELSNGAVYYIHKSVTPEELAAYGIDIEKPYRTLLTTKYTDSTKTDALYNVLLFSEPYVEDGTKYYNVYNFYQGTIVQIWAESIPFIEKDKDYFINKYLWSLSINKIDTITVDTISFPAYYAGDGVKFEKSTLKILYQMDGGVRAKTSTGLEIIENIVLPDGTRVPDAAEDSNVENYRHFYFFLSRTTMYANYLEKYIDQIKAVDLSSPQLTISYTLYDTDRTHRMDFYLFDEAGIWTFYTLDGKGRYLVRTDDLKDLILGYQAVCEGIKVTDVLGPIG